MPTRTVKAHKRVGGRVKIKSYKQKYKSDRGPVKKKRVTRSSGQVKTAWLKKRDGKFTGRAGKDGETTSRRHTMSGKDYTGTIIDQMGRIQGRTTTEIGRRKYSKEIKKSHPKK